MDGPNPQAIKRAAEKATGFRDWGDPQHGPAFEEMVRLVSREEFTPLSHLLTRQALVKACQNRLTLVEHLKANEDILRTPLGRPVFVLGFPRTGTTLLQNLLCLDPGRRSYPFGK